MKTWQVRDWLSLACCGIDGAVQVLTDCEDDMVQDGDRARCTKHGLTGTVKEYCGGMEIEWDEDNETAKEVRGE